MSGTPTITHELGVRELRLAVVLYGGVSLAIYMHGATKELHCLVRASTGTAQADTRTGSAPSEEVYRDLLAAKAAEDGVRTRVVVDTVAGTSAGGINGVYLAKALAYDLSQDALRDLWFRRGDMDAIVRGPKWLPWQARLPWVAATIWHKAPLEGDDMSGWLFDALAGMDDTVGQHPAADVTHPADEAEAGPRGTPASTLVPRGHDLELFVTLTDFHGYARPLPLSNPPAVELRHRHVMAFRHGRGHADFQPRPLHNAALALAARATSSLPGGFPPVTFAAFEAALRARSQVGVNLSDLGELERSQLFRAYKLSGADPQQAAFVDGGVLDNKPFGHALTAIQHKRAAVQVDRRLVYLDPDPSDPETPQQPGSPEPIAAAIGALTGAPRKEPILDDVLALQSRNEEVRRLRRVIETNWSAVARAVEAAVGQDLAAAPSQPDDARVRSWRDQVHDQAASVAGGSQALYVRAKIADTVDHWAHTVCRVQGFPTDSAYAAFVRSALGEWAQQAGLFQQDAPGASETQVAFLRDVDVGYRVRRLRFVLAGLGWWYEQRQGLQREDFPTPDREELDEASRVLSDALDELYAVMDGRGLPSELAPQLDRCLHEARVAEFLYRGREGVDAYLAAEHAALGDLAATFRRYLRQRVGRVGARVYRDVAPLAASWHPEARRRFALRYLGFPVWDALLFPSEAVAGVGEQDEVQIARLSPRDARLVPPRAADGKLAGAAHHHLGAFFSRAGREQDYLWGRLDAAERWVGMLLGTRHQDFRGWCQRAFAAILEEEDGAVPDAAALVDHVRAHLDERGEAVGEPEPSTGT